MKYYSPKTLKELTEIIDQYRSNASIIAGCTDIIVKNNFFDNKKAIVDITSIDELRKIEDKGDKIRIGACVTFADILNSELVKTHNRILTEAARVYGSVQIRNRGTIAGNIINASPAADSIPPLMVSKASLHLASIDKNQDIEIENFFKGPGKTIIKDNQVLAYIEFKKDKADTISFYRKIGTRKALSIAKASVAFKAINSSNRLTEVELAFGSVGPVVIPSKETKSFLEGKSLTHEIIEEASAKAYNEVTPIDDIRSSAEYRKLVVKNVIIEELNKFI